MVKGVLLRFLLVSSVFWLTEASSSKNGNVLPHLSVQSSQAKVLLNYDSRYTEIVYRDATHLEIAELDKCEIPVLLLSDEIEADIRILVFSDANHESISISSCRDPLYDLITVRAYVNSYLLEELSQGDFLNLIFQNIMQEECGEGCMICTSKTNCVTCYDTGATVNNNGNCTCVDPKATFDTTTNICICPADDVCLCNPGYFWNTTDSRCLACSITCAVCDPMENCTVCKNTVQMKNEGDGSCNCIDPNSYFDLDTSFCVCNNGFFAENYACSQCSSGCAVCAASNICNTCYDPENTVNSDTGSCVCSDPNAAFDPSSLVCACKSGFYNDNNVCTACNYGCAECTNYDDCQMCLDPPRMENTGRGICYCRDPLSVLDDKSKTCQCESGTYNNTDCIECNPTCANCTSAEECQDCHDPENMVNNNDGHCYCKIENDFYNQSSQACDKCGMGTYSNNDGLTCSMCALGCMYCDSIDNCIQCYDSNSVKDVNGKCECNDPNARFDNIDNQCVCADGYFDNGGALCAPCNTGCATCTNTTSCTECWEPYETENQGNGICSCVNITLFYDVIQHECEVCPEGSHSKGDGLNCVNCGQGCEICDAPTECTQCFDMNHMIFDGGNCTCMDMNAYFNTTTNLCECLEGYYENGDVCIECKQGCAVCQSENVCSQCFDPTRTQILTDGTCSCKDLDAFFNIQSKQCECEIGYYPSGTNCQTCSFGCAECQTGLQCNACYDPTRTINEGDGTCKCSDTNSNFVAATDNCQCKAGYFYNNNICTPCQLTCEQCLSFNTCNYCFDTNHMVNTNNGSCSCKDPHAVFNSTIKLCTCTDGYWNNDGICIGCDLTCASCNSGTTCEVCQDAENMHNLENGSCQCRKKDHKFDVKKLKCVHKSSGSSSSGSSLWWVWFLLSLIIVSGAVGGYFGYRYWKRRAWIRQRSSLGLTSELNVVN